MLQIQCKTNLCHDSTIQMIQMFNHGMYMKHCPQWLKGLTRIPTITKTPTHLEESLPQWVKGLIMAITRGSTNHPNDFQKLYPSFIQRNKTTKHS